MLQSMTGFGRGEAKSDDFRLTVEIKSVNNRFKDFRFKMSNLFNPLEMGFKNVIAKKLKRGSFEIIINYKKLKSSEHIFSLDAEKISSFVDQIKDVAKLDECDVRYKATDFLRSEFQEEVDNDDLFGMMESVVNEAFNLAMDKILEVRLQEGEKIKQALLNYLDGYEAEFSKINEVKDLYRKNIEESLLDKIKQYGEKINADKQRLLQEVIYYLEKLDINEEIDRVNFHLNSLRELLGSSSDEVGRKLDFLLQELNRETNTIGSKSGSKEISNHVVNMKSFLEKIREQGLNLQ
jgi:uncharacterized protein (TIGR00255 family)